MPRLAFNPSASRGRSGAFDMVERERYAATSTSSAGGTITSHESRPFSCGRAELATMMTEVRMHHIFRQTKGV